MRVSTRRARHSWHRVAVILVGLSAAFSVVACGEGDDTSSSSEPVDDGGNAAADGELCVAGDPCCVPLTGENICGGMGRPTEAPQASGGSQAVIPSGPESGGCGSVHCYLTGVSCVGDELRRFEAGQHCFCSERVLVETCPFGCEGESCLPDPGLGGSAGAGAQQ